MIKRLLSILITTNIYAYSFGVHSCDGVGDIKYKNALYTGECKKNKKEGRGRIVYSNGNKYEGSFKNDKKDGHGTYYYSNGLMYNGEWKKGKYNGKGSLIYSKKERYDGYFKDGKKDGKGKYKYKNGSVYEGSWKRNAKDGYGVFKYNNGVVYKGNFVKNIKEGKGKLYYITGDKYEGEFKNNKQDGFGTYSFVKGGSYTGEWSKGIRIGKGVFKYASGAVYDGFWLDNKKDGKGKYIDFDGNIYDGLWKKGKKNGFGIFTYANGQKYEGYFKDNKKDGAGIIKNQYGICRGSWSNGKLFSITEKYSAGDAYKQYNEIRLSVDMSELKYNEKLQKSAQNHSDYIALHHETIKGLGYHHEKESLSDFSGYSVKQRVVKAGYFSTTVGEGISNYCSAQQSINSLMTAIYHRFGILDFSKDELGIGFTKDNTLLKRNLVHNTGNASLNTLCQGDGIWLGSYYAKVCADTKLKIKKDSYIESKVKIQEKNPKYVIWPADGSEDNLYYFKDEVPNPMPKYKIMGNPISIQFNPYYFPENIVVYSFKLYDDNGEVSKTELLTKQTDPNKKLTKNQYALFPIEILKRDTEYKVVIKYKYKGTSKRISTSFRTME